MTTKIIGKLIQLVLIRARRTKFTRNRSKRYWL